MVLIRQEQRCSWDDAYALRLRDAVTATLGWHRLSKRYPQAAETGIVHTERTVPSLHWGEFDRDPYPLYARLRERFPAVWDEPADTWLVTRYDAARRSCW